MLVVALAAAATPASSAASTSGFGFNYWPYNGDNRILGADWQAKRAEVAADLDNIASLGGKMVRLMIWPGTGDNCNYPESPDRTWCLRQDGGGTFTAQYALEIANIPDLIRLAHERNIKVVVAFANYYITCGPAPPNVDGCPPPGGGPYWFEWAYDNFAGGSCQFMRDAATWMKGYVDAIESSPYSAAVIAYDFQNEVSAFYSYGTDPCLEDNWDYVRYLHDRRVIPLGKRGISVLCVTCANRPDDAYELRRNLGGYRFELADFHSYPQNQVNYPDIELAYDQVSQHVRAPTVILGEFGHRIPTDPNNQDPPPPAAVESQEAEQATAVTAIMQRARAKGIPYYLHWTLWDRIHGSGKQTFGLGYKPHEDGPQHSTSGPRSLLGSISSLLNGGPSLVQLVPNPDMETVANGKPQGWSIGTNTVPAGSLSLTAMGPYFADAATNRSYARVKLDPNVSGYFWLVSTLFDVTPGQRLTTNAYVRSNLTNNVELWVNEYNSSNVLVRQTHAPALPPPAGVWRWRNYLHGAGSWSVALGPNTTKATIGFVAQGGCWNPGCTSYLDVDAVSAAQSSAL